MSRFRALLIQQQLVRKQTVVLLSLGERVKTQIDRGLLLLSLIFNRFSFLTTLVSPMHAILVLLAFFAGPGGAFTLTTTGNGKQTLAWLGWADQAPSKLYLAPLEAPTPAYEASMSLSPATATFTQVYTSSARFSVVQPASASSHFDTIIPEAMDSTSITLSDSLSPRKKPTKEEVRRG